MVFKIFSIIYLKTTNYKDPQNTNQSLYVQYSKVKVLFVEKQDLCINKPNMLLNVSLSLKNIWKQTMEIQFNKNPILRQFVFKNSNNNVEFYFHKIKFLVQYNLKFQRNRFQPFLQKRLQNCYIIFFFQKKSLLNYFQECSFFRLFEQFDKNEIQNSLLNLNSQKFEKKTFWFKFLKSQNLLNDLSSNHFTKFFQSFCSKDYFKNNWKNNYRFLQNLGKQFEIFNDLKKYKFKKNQNQINTLVLKSSVSYCFFEFVLRSFKIRNYSKLPILKIFFYENSNLKSQVGEKYLVRILILCSIQLLRSTKVLKKNKNSVLYSLFNFQENSFLKINSKKYLLKQLFNQVFSLYSETLLNLSFSTLNLHSFLSKFTNPSFKLFSSQQPKAIENYIKKLKFNFYSIKKVQYKILKINLLKQFRWEFISSSNFNSFSSINLNFLKKYSFFSVKLNFFQLFLEKKLNHNNFFLQQTENLKNLEDTHHLKTQNYLFSIFQKAEIVSLKKSDSFNRFVSFSLKFQVLKNSLLILYNYNYYLLFINSKIKTCCYLYWNVRSQKKNQLVSDLVLSYKKHFYKRKKK